jgi:hypothetical protein
MPRPSSRVLRLASIAVLLLPIAAAGWLLASAPSGAPAATVPNDPVGAPIVHASDLDLDNVSLSITPGSWTLGPGGSVSFSTQLENLPVGCSIGPHTELWELVGSTGGYLNSSDGPVVAVTAYANASGSFWVEATLSATLLCPSSQPWVETPASAEVTIVPALAVGPVGLTAETATPGSLVGVRWNATGGDPPYSVRVDFGDGNATTELQDAPGPGVAYHAYRAGEYDPQVDVTDARGAEATSGAELPLEIAWGMTVALQPSTATPEVDRSFELNASVSGGSPPYAISWDVDGNYSDIIWATGISIDPATRSPIQVAVIVTGAGGGFAELNASYPVAAPPNLTVVPYRPQGDVGLAFPVNVSVAGGVAPFNLSWQVDPGGANDSEPLDAGGPWLIPLLPTDPGPIYATLSVVDADGGRYERTLLLGSADPPPTLGLAVAPGPLEPGLPVRLAVAVQGGTAPYRWSVEASQLLANVSALSGVAGPAGSANWSATVTGAGNLTLSAVVLDALGAVANASVRLTVAAPLYLGLAVENGSASDPGSATLDADVQDGIAPYELTVRVAGTAISFANLTQPGPVAWTVALPGTGYTTVSVEAVDAAGIERTRAGSAYVASTGGSGPAPPGSTAPTVGAGAGDDGLLDALAGAGLLVGVVVVGARWWGRRSPERPARSSTAPAAPALEFVRRTLAGGESLDEETLVLLAEDEGLSDAAVRGAVGRWERTGRLRREPDANGVDLLVWSPPARTGADPP